MTTVLKYSCTACDSNFTRQRRIKKCPLCKSDQIGLINIEENDKTNEKLDSPPTDKKSPGVVKWTGNGWVDDGSVPREGSKNADRFYLQSIKRD